MPIDAVILGIMTIGLLVAIPVGIALVAVLLWASGPRRGGRRS